MSEKIKFIQQRTGLGERAIQAVIKLNAEGATVAFIARYRKDATGDLDELGIMQITQTENCLRKSSSERPLYWRA